MIYIHGLSLSVCTTLNGHEVDASELRVVPYVADRVGHDPPGHNKGYWDDYGPGQPGPGRQPLPSGQVSEAMDGRLMQVDAEVHLHGANMEQTGNLPVNYTQRLVPNPVSTL